MEHIIYCPQPGCGASTQIVDRWVWRSTSGPVEPATSQDRRFKPLTCRSTLPVAS
jgi:hypothetical protein